MIANFESWRPDTEPGYFAGNVAIEHVTAMLTWATS